jgi:signal transduction histidine kinase
MEVRRKLTVQFTLIVAIILILAEIAIFIFSDIFWREDFYNRLHSKASAVAKLLIDVEGVDPALLQLIEKNNVAVLPYEEIVIYNHKGEMIFASRDTITLNITRELLNRIRVEKTVEEKQGKSTVLGFLYSGRYDRIVVVAGAIDVFGQRRLAILRNILIIVFVVAIAIIFISGFFYSNRALRPILEVIKEVTAIDEKHMHIRVNEGNGKDEMARLAKTFNQMLDRLENAFKSQRHFIANASHELRTPLAYIMGRLEVSAQRERQNEEYRSTIISAIDDLKLLAQSTNKLLLLAQSSSDSPDIPFHSIRVDEVIWEARSDVLKASRGYHIQISFTYPDEDPSGLEVRGNDMLLRTAFVNLMENGCKYSEDRTVNISIERRDSQICVRFADRGIGIPEDELELIFEPFFRSRQNITKEGHGLGLALVHQILLLHNGAVAVNSSLGKGSEFIVKLPCFSS